MGSARVPLTCPPTAGFSMPVGYGVHLKMPGSLGGRCWQTNAPRVFNRHWIRLSEV